MELKSRNRIAYFVFIGLIGLMYSVVPATHAQSTHDLKPPMQAKANTNEILMAADPNGIPTFTFAVAVINEGNVEITTATASQEKLAHLAPKPPKTPKGMVPYTENVSQTYTIQVPYTEVVDGKALTKTRMETRTRTVPVTRFRKARPDELTEEKEAEEEGKEEVDEAAPVQKIVQMEYEVNVSYVEVDDEGRKITKMRSETRIRSVPVMRGKVKTNSRTKSLKIPVGKAQFFNALGDEIDRAVVKKRLAEKKPVIVIKDKNAITPFFEQLLKPGTMFLVRPIEAKSGRAWGG